MQLFLVPSRGFDDCLYMTAQSLLAVGIRLDTMALG